MSPAALTDTPALPVARLPRWTRPVLLTATVALFVASVALCASSQLGRLCWPSTPTWSHLPSAVVVSNSFPLLVDAPISSGDDNTPYAYTSWPEEHAEAAPGNWWGVLANGAFTLRLYLPRIFTRDPQVAVVVGVVLAFVYLLVPVTLLGALFCARLGVEQARAPETGMLPGLLLFGVLMFGAGWLNHFPPAWPAFVRSTPDGEFFLWGRLSGFSPFLPVDASTFGWLLLACFAVLRADPPGRVGFGWTLAAGALGGLGVCVEPGALGNVGALGLYVWWSAGWRRALGFALGVAVLGVVRGHGGWWVGDDFHPQGRTDRLPFAVLFDQQSILLYAATFLAAALLGYRLRRWMPTNVPAAEPEPPSVEPSTPAPSAPIIPAPLPIASARRIIGVLLFVALMGTPAAVTSTMKQGGVVNGWEFIAMPLAVAAALLLTIWLEGAENVVRRNTLIALGAAVLAALGGTALTVQRVLPTRVQELRELRQSIQAHPGQDGIWPKPRGRARRTRLNVPTPLPPPAATP